MLTTKRVAIIGTGLTGLAFLSELLYQAQQSPEQQFEIDVIEKRNLQFTRVQKIILNPGALDEDQNQNNLWGRFYKENTFWHDFCRQLFFPNAELRLDEKGNLLVNEKIPTPQTKCYQLIQKFIRYESVLKDHSETYPLNCSIRQLQDALLENINVMLVSTPNVKLRWHLETQINHIDFNKNTLTLSNKENITFDYLLNCEGEKRETVNIINTEFKKINQEELAFQFSKIGHDTHHMAIKVRVKKTNAGDHRALLMQYLSSSNKSATGVLLDKLVVINNQKYTFFETPEIYDPNIYKSHLPGDVPFVPKFFVANQIPQVIHEMPDNEHKRHVLLQLASAKIRFQFGLPENMLEIDTGKQANYSQPASTFVSSIKIANTAMIELPNGSIVGLLGDAAMSAHYPIGISSTMGLNEALVMVECIIHDDAKNRPPWTFEKFTDKFEACKALLIAGVGQPAVSNDSLFPLLHLNKHKDSASLTSVSYSPFLNLTYLANLKTNDSNDYALATALLIQLVNNYNLLSLRNILVNFIQQQTSKTSFLQRGSMFKNPELDKNVTNLLKELDHPALQPLRTIKENEESDQLNKLLNALLGETNIERIIEKLTAAKPEFKNPSVNFLLTVVLDKLNKEYLLPKNIK